MHATARVSLDNFPQEVLSEIALFAATDRFLGPPSGLLPLIATNRWTYACLSLLSNPYVYAKIYQSKFDVSPAFRRLGRDSCSTISLAQELKRKCVVLNRIRGRQYSQLKPDQPGKQEDLSQLLLQIYVMVVENEGNNEQQLRHAGIDEWLTEYWFEERGASGAYNSMQRGIWPAHNEGTCLAMWLYWFLLKPEQYKRQEQSTRRALEILKVYALGAHWYPLVTPTWTEFRPSAHSIKSIPPLALYDSHRNLKAPALSVPAILAFISLLSHFQERSDFTTPVVPSHAPAPQTMTTDTIGNEWECEWGRSTNLANTHVSGFSEAYRPGSLDGIWEGIFTYTEFTSYAALLSGAPPHFLKNILVAQHKQTWKLREHHLLSSGRSNCLCGDGNGNVGVAEEGRSGPEPLSPGSALLSYFPLGTAVEESPTGVKITEPGKKPLFYHRASAVSQADDVCTSTSETSMDGHVDPEGEEERKRRVLDVIITGEGHSLWGEFNLVGRVRPCDGFISLSKDYTNGDRGKWLYRGYMVGNINPNIAGRWRDTLSPQTVPGYEGCFTMTRRH